MSALFSRLFPGLIELHTSFFTHRHGIGKNLIHYLAMSRIETTSFDFEKSKENFVKRNDPHHLDLVGLAPQDVGIFKKRASLICSNNDAYRIAMSENPTINELIEFSFMMPGWAVLFPLKVALIHHYKEWEAEKFTGFLPFGSPVISFVNSLNLGHQMIGPTPNFADHVYLQEISNRESLFQGVPSIEVNNIMYLMGKEMIDNRLTPVAPGFVPAEEQ